MGAAARLNVVVALLLAGLLAHGEGRAASQLHLQSVRPLDAAALRLAHESPSRVVSWLRRQAGVASAQVGQDGRTVDIRLRNGLEVAILPRTAGASVNVAAHLAASRRTKLQARDKASSGQRRALILLPFAADMGLYQHGQTMATLLRRTGFAVDEIDDANVTVATMATISNYDLVYDVTHSGINQGEAVVATGEQVDPHNIDPAMLPMIQEGSLMVVGVAGSTLHYYGTRSRFFADHLDGAFPHNSLVFFNSCSLLKGTLLWQALQARGVATMLAWDGLTATVDYAPNGEALFGRLAQGDTVGAALAAMQASGQGISYWAGAASHLGFAGDSTLTLDGRSSATPTPTPSPTPTPNPTSTHLPATQTPIPATATVQSLPPLSVTLRRLVRPGRKQVIRAMSTQNHVIRFQVVYPNGDTQHAVRMTGAKGRVRYAYIQPRHKIRRGHRLVKVIVTAGGAGRDTIVTKMYRIARA